MICENIVSVLPHLTKIHRYHKINSIWHDMTIDPHIMMDDSIASVQCCGLCRLLCFWMTVLHEIQSYVVRYLSGEQPVACVLPRYVSTNLLHDRHIERHRPPRPRCKRSLRREQGILLHCRHSGYF